MQRSIYLCIIILFVSCKYPKSNEKDVSVRIPSNIELKNKVNLLIGPGQIKECYQTEIDGIDYLISIDNGKRPKFILTSDKEFMTIDGIKVGMKFSEVIKRTKHTPYLVNGWAYVIPLDSGWKAAFKISDYDLKEMSSDSIVNWIFKDKWKPN